MTRIECPFEPAAVGPARRGNFVSRNFSPGTPRLHRSIGAHRQLGNFFQALSHSLAGIIPFDGIGVSLYDEEHQTTQLYQLETDVPSDIPVGRIFRAEEAPTAAVLQTGAPFYAPDLDNEQRFPAVNLMLRRHGIRSYCVIP